MPKSIVSDERIYNTMRDLRPFPEPIGMGGSLESGAPTQLILVRPSQSRHAIEPKVVLRRSGWGLRGTPALRRVTPINPCGCQIELFGGRMIVEQTLCSVQDGGLL